MVSTQRRTAGRFTARAGRRCIGAALLAAVAASCSQQNAGQTTTQYMEMPEGADGTVLARQRDALANRDAEETLTKVHYGVIERDGPKPAWDTFKKSTSATPKDVVAAAEAAQPPERVNPDEVFESTVFPTIAPPKPTTQPTTQPANGAAVANAVPTGPVAPPPSPFPVPSKTIDETNLPVRVVELPDGKVRLIWTLRSFGGAGVTTTRDPSTARRTVNLTPPDLGPLVTVLTQFIGTTGLVTPLPKENVVVVTCDRNLRSSVLEMLAKLDTPPRQVEISAKVFEVSRDFDYQQGANILAKRISLDNSQTGLSLFPAQRAVDAASGVAPFQGSVISLMKTFQEQGLAIDASFQILADAGLIKVVSSPRMTVAAGQTGYMLAGQELPIQSANLVNNVLTTATTYKPVGVQLYITPQAVGPDRVKLHTISIVSQVAGFAPLPNITGKNDAQMLVNPIIESREAETAVTVSDGETLVISGLRMIRTTTRENKIPGLGDIPFLGALFKNHRSQQHQTDLYFFVTPSLL